ncbi:MAG: ComEC/Rec2 family competence protein, partial [Pseudomonadota bacterium]
MFAHFKGINRAGRQGRLQGRPQENSALLQLRLESLDQARLHNFVQLNRFAIWCVGIVAAMCVPYFLPIPLFIHFLIPLVWSLCWLKIERARSLSILTIYLSFCFSDWQVTEVRAAWIEAEFEKKPISLVASVDGLPQTKQDNVSLQLEVIKAETLSGESALKTGSRVRISCYRCRHEFVPNQNWRLLVKLKRPRGFASWGAFDYEKYLFRHGIVATGYISDQAESMELTQSSAHFDADGLRWRISQQIGALVDRSVQSQAGLRMSQIASA